MCDQVISSLEIYDSRDLTDALGNNLKKHMINLISETLYNSFILYMHPFYFLFMRLPFQIFNCLRSSDFRTGGMGNQSVMGKMIAHQRRSKKPFIQLFRIQNTYRHFRHFRHLLIYMSCCDTTIVTQKYQLIYTCRKYSDQTFLELLCLDFY